MKQLATPVPIAVRSCRRSNSSMPRSVGGADTGRRTCWGNTFNRRGLDVAPLNNPSCRTFPVGAGGPVDDQVSARDRSRLLQYYAREMYPNWGFFESLNIRPGLFDYDGLPNP
jgi:hypothetical protein